MRRTSGERLLLPVDQQTGISGIDRDQLPVFVAGSVESVVGTPSNCVVLVAGNGSCVVETIGDRPDDLVLPVANVLLYE